MENKRKLIGWRYNAIISVFEMRLFWRKGNLLRCESISVYLPQSVRTGGGGWVEILQAVVSKSAE